MRVLEELGDTSVNLDTGTTIDVLSAERRRHAIRELASVDGTITLAELVDRIAEKEYETPIDSSQRKTVYVTTYQNHVPALTKAGLIQYDRGDLTPTNAVKQLAQLLAEIEATCNGGVS